MTRFRALDRFASRLLARKLLSLLGPAKLTNETKTRSGRGHFSHPLKGRPLSGVGSPFRALSRRFPLPSKPPRPSLPRPSVPPLRFPVGVPGRLGRVPACLAGVVRAGFGPVLCACACLLL